MRLPKIESIFVPLIVFYITKGDARKKERKEKNTPINDCMRKVLRQIT